MRPHQTRPARAPVRGPQASWRGSKNDAKLVRSGPFGGKVIQWAGWCEARRSVAAGLPVSWSSLRSPACWREGAAPPRTRPRRSPSKHNPNRPGIPLPRSRRSPKQGPNRERPRRERSPHPSPPPLLPSQTPRPRKPRPLTKQPRRSHASWTGTPSRSRRRSAGSPT